LNVSGVQDLSGNVMEGSTAWAFEIANFDPIATKATLRNLLLNLTYLAAHANTSSSAYRSLSSKIVFETALFLAIPASNTSVTLAKISNSTSGLVIVDVSIETPSTADRDASSLLRELFAAVQSHQSDKVTLSWLPTFNLSLPFATLQVRNQCLETKQSTTRLCVSTS
jgi:hypothetical protein